MNKKIYYIYTRTSSPRTFKDGVSVFRQKEVCTRYIVEALNGAIAEKVYSDQVRDHIPLLQRTQLVHLLEDISQQPLKNRNIVVESVSRLGRSATILIELKEVLKTSKIKIIPVDRPDFRSLRPKGIEKLSQILTWEKETLLQKHKATYEYYKEKRGILTYDGVGKFQGRKNIYQTFKKEVDYYFKNNLNIKKSLDTIRVDFYEIGIRTKLGKPISKSTASRLVNYLLKNSLISNMPSLESKPRSNSVNHLTGVIKRKYSTNTRDKKSQSIKYYSELFKAHYSNYILYLEKEGRTYIYNPMEGIWKYNTRTELEKLIYMFLNERDHANLIQNTIKQIAYLVELSSHTTEWPEKEHRQYILLSNGVLDLNNKNILEFSPNYYFRSKLPYTYDPNKKIIPENDFPKINKWLMYIGQESTVYKEIIISYLHCVIFNITSIQKYLEIIGPGGTGKSTLIALSSAIIGKENIVSTELKYLEKNRFETSGLRNKKLIIINDSARYTGDVSLLKSLVGGDVIRIEEKGKNIQDPVHINALVIVAANEPLQFNDVTSGIYRRKIYLQLDRKPAVIENLIDTSKNPATGEFIPELENLFQYLVDYNTEEALSNIRNSNQCEILGKLLRQNIKATNPLAAFIIDKTVQSKKKEDQVYIVNNESEPFTLYNSYIVYCKQYRYSPLSYSRYLTQLSDVFNNLLKWDVEIEQRSVTVITDRCRGLKLVDLDFGFKTIKNIKPGEILIEYAPSRIKNGNDIFELPVRSFKVNLLDQGINNTLYVNIWAVREGVWKLIESNPSKVYTHQSLLKELSRIGLYTYYIPKKESIENNKLQKPNLNENQST